MDYAYDIDGNILLSWELAPDAEELRLVRKLQDYPRTTADGETLLHEPGPPLSESYTDTTPFRKKVNYYTLFVKDTGGVWTEQTTRMPVWDFYDWASIMYARLPEAYQRRDTQQEPTLPLQRYLKLVGFGLERLRHLYEAITLHKDPYEIEENFLEALGWDVGWILNKELPVLRQRMEIARAVYMYKRKGTAAGLEALIHSIINWDVEVIDPKYNILFRNRWRGVDPLYDGTRLNTSDEDVRRYMGTSRDTIDYRMGDYYRPDRVHVILTATDDFEIFNRAAAKLLRILSEWIPECTSYTLTLQTKNEDSGALGEYRPPDPDLLMSNWLLRSHQPTVPNPNQFELLGYRTRNNLLWRRPK